MLSVVIPSYNEEENIPRAARTISGILEREKIPYELIFVNDGSSDRSWECIRKEAAVNPNIHGLCFSRNFGKESAIFAGLRESRGSCTAVIDCDLQHPPEKLVEMYRLWEQGYEIVEGVKNSRGEESGGHRAAAKMFYRIISRATGIDMSNASDFKLLDRKAVTVLINMPEKNAFFRALSSWIGFKTIKVSYDVQERQAGTSKWSTRKLISYALTNISSFTTFPMQFVTVLGVIMLVVAIVLSVTALVQKIMGVALGGFTTVIILLCFTGSVIMISLGIIGYYLAKIYEEVQGRPRYILTEKF
ncbi:MAG: glycosyltransferase [Lachnospiraceae bacterium]|jgi:glycosyltransferase involved in cell wall biosynthesis